ncbi:MAG TPA: SH3 domain-containing protein, partial [Anaerolineales bacterium]|nr:SH3 domain-containing protein [Anaerolineales bacterium]
MFRTNTLVTLGILILMVSACGPVMGIPQQPQIEPNATPIVGMAIVQSVEIHFIEHAPPKVSAVVRGQLPDAGCTTIAAIDQTRDGNTFHLVIMTTTDPLALCAPALTPFEETILLDTSELPAAKYIVSANGIEASFELLPRDISIFKQQLVGALNARDFDLLRAMMNESLMISHWRSEGTMYEVEAAIEQLRLNYLNMTSTIVAEPQKNLIELLDGIDPISIVGPNVNGTNALFVSGLGSDGRDEAILYVAAQADGGLYWHGFLFAPGGFKKSAQPIDTTVYATNIQYVTAEKDLAIYSGPGSNFTIIGNLLAGQVAVVTGKNVDENWWHVACENNSASDCWVSADKNLTRPSTAVQGFQPAPEPEKTPTITILAVTQNDQVTIRTQNFPADTKFSVRMGKIGTTGIDGIL